VPDIRRTFRWGARAAAVAMAFLPTGCDQEKATPQTPSIPGTVGSGGGTVVLADGAVTVEVPAGALDGSVTFTATVSDADDPALGMPRVRLGPSGTSFAAPVTVRLAVDPAAVAELADLADLTVAVRTDEGWQGVPATADAGANQVSFRVLSLEEPVLERATGAFRRGGSSVGVVAYAYAPSRPPATPSCERELVLGGGLDFGVLVPKYVDPVAGDDRFAGDVGAPWKTITKSVGKLLLGQKLVVRAGTYRNDPTLPDSLDVEVFPLDLPPNVVLEGQGGVVLHGVPNPAGLTPILRIASSPNFAYVRGIELTSDADPAVPAGDVDRHRAIVVSGGSPTFENVTSESTSGIEVTGGEPAFLGLSLRTHAAHLDVRGGAVSVVGGTIRSQVNFANADSAGIHLDAGSVCVQGMRISGAHHGVQAPSSGSLTLVESRIESNQIGVLLGTIPVDLSTSVTYEIRDNRFSGNARASVATASPAESTSLVDNQYPNDPPQVWHGPPPFFEPVDIAHLLNPLGNPRWWQHGAGPSARFGMSAARAAETGEFVMFGGANAGGVLSDTWTWNPVLHTWTDVTDPASLIEGRIDAMMCAVPGRAARSVLLVGGHTNGSPDRIFGCDSVWVFDAAAREWILEVTSGPTPSSRYGAVLTPILPGSDVLFLHGGIDATGQVLSECWSLDTSTYTWSPCSISTPPGRAFHQGVSVPEGVLYVGGITTSVGGAPTGTAISFRNAVWSTVSLVGDDPGAVMLHRMVPVLPLTTGNLRMVLTGGTDGPTIPGHEVVLTLDAAGDAWAGASWTPLSTVPDTPHPPARARHLLLAWERNGYDEMVCFGGLSDTGAPLGDTWIYMRGGGARLASSFAGGRPR